MLDFSLKEAAPVTLNKHEPVWPSGKAGKHKDLSSIPLPSSFFKSRGLWTRTQSCKRVSVSQLMKH